MKIYWTEKARKRDIEQRASTIADRVVEGVLAQNAQGGRSSASATAALEIAAGIVGRAFASARIGGSDTLAAALPGWLLNMIGRQLITGGDFVGAIQRGNGAIRVTPSADWDITGSADPRSWQYAMSLSGPSGETRLQKAPASRVIHLRYAATATRPWVGRGPLQIAREAGRLSAATVSALADESQGPRGYLLPVPDSDGLSDKVSGLRADLAGLAGRLATIETQQSLAADTGQRRGREWEVTRIGARPPMELVELQNVATREVLGACGIPLPMVIDSQGTALREAWRIFLFSTVAPLGRILADELTLKFGQPITIEWDELRASDLAGRARAFQSMVGAGMDINQAAALSGLMTEEG